MARCYGVKRLAAVGLGTVVALTSGPALSIARSQVIKRDTIITGPGGRTVERKLESVRTPGFIERSTTITRPNGTISRSVVIPRGGPAFVGRPPHHFRGGWGYRPAPVVINNGPSALGAGLVGAAVGAAGGLLLGRALSTPAPPPPAYVMPATPAYVVQGAPPVTVAQPVAPAAPVVVAQDPIAVEVARLSSRHESSRVDAVGNLGRMRDPRAIPALVDRLKNDHSKDVRTAAATALGEIGDPNAAVILERAVIYDKKQEVRDAASVALSRLPRPTTVPAEGAPATVTGPELTNAPAVSPPQLEPAESVPPPPTPVR
jgi:hypothetical protein